MEFKAGGGQLLAKFDSRGAKIFADADHFGAQVGARDGDAFAIFRDTIGKKPNLSSDFAELSGDLLAQGIKPPTETSDRFEYQVKARGKLLQYRPHLRLHFLSLGFVRHR
jgi:hypothetical protein